MNAKITSVSLECNSLGRRDFPFEQAEGILKNAKNRDWHLPKDSPFEFVNNELGLKPNKKGDSGKPKKGDD